MAITRRAFFKFGLAAGTGALLSWYINKVNHNSIDVTDIPGSGEVGHFDQETLDHINVDAFLAACSRCGVCIQECPFSAIKSTGWQLPLLTDATRIKCPGMDVCGVCLAVCPTSALSQAFASFEDLGIKPGVEKDPWYEGKRINTDFLDLAETEEGD